MQNIKKTAVAGSFYPADADELKRLINKQLAKANKHTAAAKIIIAPHAGLIYSGEIAANVYAHLEHQRATIKRVILLGPTHHLPFSGFALPSQQYFSTPLGNIEIDQASINKLLTYPLVEIYDEPFLEEHCLEVQLPFLQTLLDDFKIVPILISQTQAAYVSDLLLELMQGPETLIIISTDLSHFHDYATALCNDINTSLAIQALNYQSLTGDNACGIYPLAGALHLADRLGYTAKIIDLRNSGDTAGIKDRVVGYGGYHLYSSDEANGCYSLAQKEFLNDLAKKVIEYGVEHHSMPKNLDANSIPFNLDLKVATFVTLELDGNLRGCMGNIEATDSVINSVTNNAYLAAFGDNRFSSLTRRELSRIKIAITVLSSIEELEFTSEQDLINQLRPAIDGLVLKDSWHRGLYLPQVWEYYTSRKDFLHSLKEKSGLTASYWSSSLKFYRFTTTVV